jgi:uncharacterized membrane protein
MSFKTFTLLMLCMMMVSLGAACGDDGDDGGASGMGGDGDGDGDCENVPSYEAVAAFDTCTMCHASDKTGAARNGAPADHNFDSFEGAVEHLGHIVEEVEEGKMPPANSGLSITAQERADLLLWAECGSPE